MDPNEEIQKPEEPATLTESDQTDDDEDQPDLAEILGVEDICWY
jgi:hypothetical protein